MAPSAFALGKRPDINIESLRDVGRNYGTDSGGHAFDDESDGPHRNGVDERAEADAPRARTPNGARALLVGEVQSLFLMFVLIGASVVKANLEAAHDANHRFNLED